MIIGKGLLAQAFARDWQEDPSVAILAAGVSNSAETDPQEFAREHRLLQHTLANSAHARIVYFSSCAVGNPLDVPTPYIAHKARMEALILADPRGQVFRLPQVVGSGGNPNTLVNFLRARIESGEHFQVWAHAERNLIDIDDVARIATHVLQHAQDYPRMMALADLRSSNMLTIVRQLEQTMGRKGNYVVLEKGALFPIDTDDCQRAASRCGVALGSGYLEALLAKYCAK